MACGPVGIGGKAAAPEEAQEAFNFGHDTALSTSFNNLALLWSTPFRAAMVFASEAMGHGDKR